MVGAINVASNKIKIPKQIAQVLRNAMKYIKLNLIIVSFVNQYFLFLCSFSCLGSGNVLRKKLRWNEVLLLTGIGMIFVFIFRYRKFFFIKDLDDLKNYHFFFCFFLEVL